MYMFQYSYFIKQENRWNELRKQNIFTNPTTKNKYGHRTSYSLYASFRRAPGSMTPIRSTFSDFAKMWEKCNISLHATQHMHIPLQPLNTPRTWIIKGDYAQVHNIYTSTCNNVNNIHSYSMASTCIPFVVWICICMCDVLLIYVRYYPYLLK